MACVVNGFHATAFKIFLKDRYYMASGKDF